VQQWKARYEQEGLVKIDEIEEAKWGIFVTF
jgi:hypothetical protein